MLKIKESNNNMFIFVGDIHGEFEPFVYHITHNLNIDNVNLIICGDFGMGFHKQNYYTTLFKKLQKKLKKNNVHLYAFRGNHDDPKYFNDEIFISQVLDGVKNIHLIDDYDIIKNDYHTILCIGGARSIDKTNRWKWDHITQTQIPCGWWKDENVQPLPEGFNEFVKSNNLSIDIICTHTSPNFCEPLTKGGLEFWAKYDDTLITDCENERQLLTDIFTTISKNHHIKYWFYGHFHAPYILIDNGVLFRGLNCFNDTYNFDLYQLYNEEIF